MSESKTTPIVIAVCTVIVSGLLLFVASLLMDLREALDDNGEAIDDNGEALSTLVSITPGWGWEYDVVIIEDSAWDTTAKALGKEGWEIVNARRASGADDKYAYECIVRRALRPG